MGIINIFSKRQKLIRGEHTDVYQYNDIPEKLRVQIIHIVRDALGDDYRQRRVQNVYELVHKTICREHGVFRLKDSYESDSEAIFYFLLRTDDFEHVLDTIEILFKAINHISSEPNYEYEVQTRKMSPDEAIDELNERFKEHGVGYQFQSGEIIRNDSEYMHSKAVKPALKLLAQEKIFKGANQEFLSAHEHYRHGRYKESLVDASKSFESVMKAICETKKWKYDKNDTAKKLIDICLQNGLIPDFLQSQQNSFRSLLESGIPTIRNKLGGHGQGTTITDVNESLSSYMLHLTASNILFLARLALKK
ncbi:hypothetical protein P3G55_17600 [Leptospira sp. 96542]|nr:hypothetical protein [Leptospira sp. 96542]